MCDIMTLISLVSAGSSIKQASDANSARKKANAKAKADALQTKSTEDTTRRTQRNSQQTSSRTSTNGFYSPGNSGTSGLFQARSFFRKG